MRYFYILFLLLIFMDPKVVHAQKKSFWYTHLTTNEGLSRSFVISIIQDKDGFMWFGTMDGLNKFDGNKFVIYRNNRKDPNSISHNYIRKLILDEKGRLWIGSQGGGLSRYDSEKNIFINYKHNDSNPNSISHNTVNAVVEDAKGNFWVGTFAGLDYFDIKTQKFTHYRNNPADPKSLSNNEIRSLLVDRKGNLWVGTVGGGLNRLIAPIHLNTINTMLQTLHLLAVIIFPESMKIRKKIYGLLQKTET